MWPYWPLGRQPAIHRGDVNLSSDNSPVFVIATDIWVGLEGECSICLGTSKQWDPVLFYKWVYGLTFQITDPCIAYTRFQ